MVKYLGPKYKILKKLDNLPGFTKKKYITNLFLEDNLIEDEPGELPSNTFDSSNDYFYRLIEKQKLRFNYGISENKLKYYYNKSKKFKKQIINNFLNFLEMRLDCIVWRLGFSKTISSARQIINHGHIIINNKKVNIASFICKKNDKIKINKKNVSKILILDTFRSQLNFQKKVRNSYKRYRIV